VHRPGFDPADIDAGEQLLCRFAGDFGPKELNRLAQQVIDSINPDGTRPKDELNHDRRFLHLRPTRDGAYAGEFRLTGQAGVKLAALLGPLSKPRINTATGPDGQLVDSRTRSTTANGCTTPSKTSATGCCVPTTRCPTQAAPRHRDHHHRCGLPTQPDRLRRHRRRHPDPVGHRPADD
jgi:hypothetical protein